MERTPTVRRSDIRTGLEQLGLKAGDVVLVHSSLASFGHVEGGPEALLAALLDVLGADGTLVVPVFGALGVFTEVVRNAARAVRSVHPKAAVAAIGRDAEAICRDHWKAELVHGPDTPYMRIADLGGYVLLLGVDHDRSTMLHACEEILHLAYLTRTQDCTFETPTGTVTKSWPYFPGPHRDFMQHDRMLRDRGVMVTGRIGNCVARLIRAREMVEVMVEYGRSHPDWALCDNPNCADCVRQRASLQRARLGAEAFRVAASSGLAGYYLPEMIENLQAAGIDAIELDVVQGEPAYRFGADRLREIVAGLAAAGISVAGLRIPALTEDNAPVLEALQAAGIRRVLLPLTGAAAEVAELARARAQEAVFYNQSISSGLAGKWLLDLRASGYDPRFCFNAANFAGIGEKPFLHSYKQKLRRFMDQLDIQDGTWAGAPTALARGNAEIKEMISILRCASFGGWFVLRAHAGSGHGLRATAGRFIELLERM